MTKTISRKLLILAALCGIASMPAVSAPGIALGDLDQNVNRCEDFYSYANGNWVKNNSIPPDQGRWGAFNEITERNNQILHDIAEEAAAANHAAAGSALRKVGDFYRSGMDEAQIEAAGVKPLAEDFSRIDSVKDGASLLKTLAWLHQTRPSFNWRGPQPTGFGFVVRQDAKNSLAYMAHLFQGGLGLPDRDYYLKDDNYSKQLLAKYEAHVARMLELLGANSDAAKAGARAVLRIETRLARAAMNIVERRDPDKTYHKMTLKDLNALAPDLDWSAYFTAIGIADPGALNVQQPEFFREFGKMVKEEPLENWQTYLRWHLANAWADHLPRAFVDQNFVLRGKLLSGKEAQAPRWKRVVESADLEIGPLLGQLFVARSFPPEAKSRMDAMIINIKAAMRERIEGLDWMGEETRKAAVVKLDAIVWKIGYPEKWRDLSALEVTPDSYLDNTRRAARFNFDYRNLRLGKPIDRTEWGMTASTVNAYYSANLNEIVFPAGILQPPFFDAKSDDAANYGAIGMVIGHELTHGFDDNGRKYDASGNLRNWWTKDDETRFLQRVGAIQKQYDGYSPLPGMPINGKLTTGENIADFGGLKVSYAAFQKTGQAKGKKSIDGFTPEQRFFLSFAQSWRASSRLEQLRTQLATDSHSPPRFRVLGPLSNFAEFFSAFGCSNGEDGKSFARRGSDIVTIW